MSQEQHGTTRERQVREIAARLGVADFVYFASPVQKGAALREAAGDGLLLVGDRGAILQVKARDPEKAGQDSPARARKWAQKYTALALRQGLGTKREIARRLALGTPLAVVPARAASLPEETKKLYVRLMDQDTTHWPVVVILDHPSLPVIDLEFNDHCLWFTYNDWLELQVRLRSTSATIHYVQRALRDRLHGRLGEEALRYAALYAADLDSVAASPGRLPMLADPGDFDELGAAIFHDILDKVWPSDGIIPWRSADEYRSIVEFLDSIPPQAQSALGRWFLQKRRDIQEESRVSSGLSTLDHRDRLVFACSHLQHWPDAHSWLAQFTLLTALRHSQALESGAPKTTKTLGIAALVEGRGEHSGAAYSFVLLSGLEAALKIPSELRRAQERRFGIFNHASGMTKEVEICPDEPCPCMSGRSFSQCCGAQAGRR